MRLACAGLALAALVPAAAAAPAFDDQRLFTTAAERARLDALRAAAEPEVVSPDEGRAARGPAVTEADPPPPAAPIRLRGFVRRSGGPDAVWVNDASSVRGDLPDELRIHSGRLDGAAVVITLPDGRSIRLKAGQTWDPESGRVVDSYRAD